MEAMELIAVQVTKLSVVQVEITVCQIDPGGILCANEGVQAAVYCLSLSSVAEALKNNRGFEGAEAITQVHLADALQYRPKLELI